MELGENRGRLDVVDSLQCVMSSMGRGRNYEESAKWLWCGKGGWRCCQDASEPRR